jgi:hypothetical protein
VRRLPPNGLEAWAAVLERGHEGLVAKDEASLYRGGVTRSWLKVKVPGWTDAEDRVEAPANSALRLSAGPAFRGFQTSYLAGPGGGGGGAPGGGGGSTGDRVVVGASVSVERQPRPGTGIWLSWAYMHCM